MEMNSLLGSCNVYWRVVPKFAGKAAPLNIMLKEGGCKQLDNFSPEGMDALQHYSRTLKSHQSVYGLIAGMFKANTDIYNSQIGSGCMQDQPDVATNQWGIGPNHSGG